MQTLPGFDPLISPALGYPPYPDKTHILSMMTQLQCVQVLNSSVFSYNVPTLGPVEPQFQSNFTFDEISLHQHDSVR